MSASGHLDLAALHAEIAWMAAQYVHHPGRIRYQMARLSFCKAVWAKPVPALVVGARAFQSIGQRSTSGVGKLIAFGISVKLFELRIFCFERSDTITQKLFLLSRIREGNMRITEALDQARLYLSDLRAGNRGIETLRDVERALHAAHRAYDCVQHDLKSPLLAAEAALRGAEKSNVIAGGAA